MEESVPTVNESTKEIKERLARKIIRRFLEDHSLKELDALIKEVVVTGIMES